MGIKISYDGFNNYEYSFLEHAINAEIGAITTKELQHKQKELLTNANVGTMVYNDIEDNKEFIVDRDPYEYISSQEGKMNIIGYYYDIFLTGMALTQLVREKFIMPVQQRKHKEYWLKISSINGSNAHTKVELDLIPFDKFMVIKVE